jgi:transcriptional regulator with XRE-family HTH domain
MVCQYMAMAGREPEIGATSRTVAENVKRLRMAQNMSFTQLSERLAEAANWDINPVGVRRIETWERRVTPDDLTALAVALGVTPATLLMPPSDSESDRVAVTGVSSELTAQHLWGWLTARKPLPGARPMTLLTFGTLAWPEWETLRVSGELNVKFLDRVLDPRGDADGDD